MAIDPATLSGKTLWLRAKDLGAAGSNVTTWTDQSGAGNDSTGLTGTAPVVAGASTPAGGKSVDFGAGYFTFDAVLGKASATTSSDFNASGFPATNLLDDDPSSWWAAAAGGTQWVQLRETAGPRVITSYSILPRSGFNDQAPATWKFQGSSDAAAWTDLDSRTGVSFASGAKQVFAFSNSTAYRYHRLLVTAINGGSQLAMGALRLSDELPAQGEMWLVVQGTGTTNYNPYLAGTSTQDLRYSFSGQWYDDFGATTRINFTPPASLTSWRLIRVKRDATNRTWFVDNASAFVDTAAATFPRTMRLGNSGSGNFDGFIAEALIFNRVLTGAEIADLVTYFNAEHGLTVPGGSSGVVVPTTTGTSPATVASSSASALVNVATGTAAVSVASSARAIPVASTTGTGPVGVGSSSVASLVGVTPVVTGTSPVEVGSSAAAALVVPVTTTTGAGPVGVGSSSAASLLTTTTGAAPITVDSSSRTVRVGGLDYISAHSTTRITSAIATALEVDYISAHSTTRITSSIVSSFELAIDPVTGRPQYRLIVVDSHGTPLGELQNAAIGDPVQKLGQPGMFTATLPSRDPKATLLDVGAQVQVWAGAQMLPGAWFVLVQPGKDGGGSISYDFAGLEGLLANVVIGTERPELLKNGGFEDDLRYWHGTWLAGSAAEAPPKMTIVSGALAKEGGKALQVEAVESVNVREVKTAAIFYGNRPSASEPLADGFLPGGEKLITDQLPAFSKGTALLVEGFTADVDSGDGQALSERRAEAAKAVIVKARPDLKVTAIGRGESVQVAPNNTEANQAKNRRILLTGTATRIGHRQIVRQYFRWTNTSRVPIELELDGWIDLIDYVGPSKDRYAFYINRISEADPAKPKIVQAEHTDLPEDFPHSRWTPDGTSALSAPPDGKEYLYDVRLYGSAGKTIFDEVSVKPNLRTGFYGVTRPELFAGLVAEAQNTEHGKVDLNLEANCPAWGVRDDYEYEWKTPRTVWDAIEEQLRSDDAPDFGIVTTQTRRIATTWAKRGRRSPVHLRLGDIVTGYTAGVDGDKVATTAIATSNRSRGPGVGEARVWTAPINGLVFERVQAAEPDRSQTRLRQMATAMTRYGRTDVLTSVTCDPKWTVKLLGQVGLGDRVWCVVHDGDTHVEGWYRIVEIRHSISKHQLSYELITEV